MTRFLIDFVRSWFTIARANRHVFALHRKCDRLDRNRVVAESRLSEATADAAVVYKNIRDALTSAQQTIQQYEDTTKELRSEAAVKDREIIMLVAQHTKFLERYRTETAIEVQRRSANSPPGDYGA